MKPESDLAKLRRASQDRVARVRSVGESVSMGSHAQLRDECVTYCILELYNAWYGFNRSLYLSSAFRARQVNGVRITLTSGATPATLDDALTIAIHVNKPKLASRVGPWSWFDEPAWEKPKVLLSSLGSLGASNYTQVSNGLSLQTLTSIPSHFKKFRNFYAHRSQSAHGELRGLLSSFSVGPQTHASDCLLRRATTQGVTRPQALLLDMIDDVANVMALMV